MPGICFDNIYYVYMYCDSRYLYKNDYLPFYIGMGKEQRLFSNDRNKTVLRYIDILEKNNIEVIKKLYKKDLFRNDAITLESNLIDLYGSFYGNTGYLLNKYIPSKCGYFNGIKNEQVLFEKYNKLLNTSLKNKIIFKKDSKTILKKVKLSNFIISKIKEFLILGRSINDISNMFNISTDDILNNIELEFISRWVV